MNRLLSLREDFGELYATTLPNDEVVPWRPLSIGEYLKYDKLFKKQEMPQAYIENEVFSLCVLDKSRISNINIQLAGTISTVVSTIMDYSGPQSTSELNQLLDNNRIEADNIIHELVGFITLAFPAYKPEDIYEMDYELLLLRTAQAERKLLTQGFITEPLSFGIPEETIAPPIKSSSELHEQYYEQQGIKFSEEKKQKQKDLREKILDHPAPPPVPSQSMETTVISKSDIMEHRTVMSGHDLDVGSSSKETKELTDIYSTYIDQMREGKELKILTPEERIKAAKVRMEANKQKTLVRQKEAKAEDLEELPKLLEIREEARKRKAKKAARRK